MLVPVFETHSGSQTSLHPRLVILQAFLLRARQGALVDQDALSFIPLSGPAEADDDG
ncbi:MAG: hypothetical protein OXH99_12285 [Bryobacterales bacterium]|nr:hypothetical protein [Bryobacterales bacterium]